MNPQDLFGPLPVEYCSYFYFLSVFGMLFLILSIFGGLYIGMTRKKSSTYYVQMLMMSMTYLVIYFQNRLLYSMCVRK